MTTLKSHLPLSVLSMGMIITLLALLLPAFAQAAPLALPPRPPTPTPIPTYLPPVQLPAVMASIELQVRFGPKWSWGTMTWEDLRTVVQWQDTLGGWHAVDGWRGALDEFVDDKGYKVWGVAEKDFGSGPFRWVVTDGKSDKPIATSNSFNLPARSKARVIVEVMLEKSW